jgi:S-ribosylhomocysteine lyase LuxS involved in autoinducer biosynthesis
MSVTVEQVAAHSGSKDHLAMTGGTLSADKLVHGDAPLRLQREFFPVTTLGTQTGTGTGQEFGHEQGPSRERVRRLFAGIHSIEHALASPLGGDLRACLDEAGEAGLGKRLLDMSPYLPGLLDAGDTSELVLGFRATLASDGEPVPRELVEQAYRSSLRTIVDRFTSGAEVPFSTPEACGQYDLHSARSAVELLSTGAIDAAAAAITCSDMVETGAWELYVCDLRLVKPRLPGAGDQRMLDLLGGHYVSQAIEADAWRSLPGARPGAVTTGNFGCSTGEYLMVADVSAGEAGREPGSVLLDAHVAVVRTLAGVAAYEGSDLLRQLAAQDARFALSHIEQHSPEVWSAAD